MCSTGLGHETTNFGVQRSKVKVTGGHKDKVRFGGVVEASFSTHLGQVGLVVTDIFAKKILSGN